jgi:hypothetical protein
LAEETQKIKFSFDMTIHSEHESFIDLKILPVIKYIAYLLHPKQIIGPMGAVAHFKHVLPLDMTLNRDR